MKSAILHDKEFLSALKFEPVTRNNWPILVEFLDPGVPVETAGACIIGWVNQNFLKARSDQGNKKALQDLVWDNKPVGLIARL